MPLINPRAARQSIFTKTLGVTHTKGDRIKAYCRAGSLIVGQSVNSITMEEDHANAAMQLARQLGWDDLSIIQGGNPDGQGYVFVFFKGVV